MSCMFTPGFHLISQRRQGFHCLLRIGGIIPKIRAFYFSFKFPKFKFLVREVKDAPIVAGLIRWLTVIVKANPALMISKRVIGLRGQNSIYKSIRIKGNEILRLFAESRK